MKGTPPLPTPAPPPAADEKQPLGPVVVHLELAHKVGDSAAWASLRFLLKRCLRIGGWKCVGGSAVRDADKPAE